MMYLIADPDPEILELKTRYNLELKCLKYRYITVIGVNVLGVPGNIFVKNDVATFVGILIKVAI